MTGRTARRRDAPMRARPHVYQPGKLRKLRKPIRKLNITRKEERP